MAKDAKSHRALHGHIKQMRQHLQNANDTADKIEQVLSAMQGQGQDQQPQPPAASPGSAPSSGVSPLGGQASGGL